jgi:hypothetical protein
MRLEKVNLSQNGWLKGCWTWLRAYDNSQVCHRQLSSSLFAPRISTKTSRRTMLVNRLSPASGVGPG